MNVARWVGFFGTGLLVSACGGYSSLGEVPGAGGETDAMGGSQSMGAKGGRQGYGGTGMATGGSMDATGGTGMGTGGSMNATGGLTHFIEGLDPAGPSVCRCANLPPRGRAAQKAANVRRISSRPRPA